MRYVTITWDGGQDGAPNRLTVSHRLVLAAGGLLLLAVFCCLVLAAVTVRLQRETAALHARCAALDSERSALQVRVRAIEAEVVEARTSLARVRAEEAKIRSWLGLEAQGGEADTDVPEELSGGKGSLGDEGLETVDPRDRDAEAEVTEAGSAAGIGEESRALASDLAELALQVQRQRELWDSVPAVPPVDGEHWISSAFGWRQSPFTGRREFHNGLDMAGRKGTPIVAAANGTVLKVFNDPALGKGLTLDHGNGIRTIYGHLDEVRVETGQAVTRGDRIGDMGSTGKRSTGPHLHYGVKVDGKYVNPKNYLLDPSRLPFSVAKN